VSARSALAEADFAGEHELVPLEACLRPVGKFLGGQTWSTFADPEAEPDGIDFEGLNAIFYSGSLRSGGPRLFVRTPLAIAAESQPRRHRATRSTRHPTSVARILDREEYPLFGFLAKGGHFQAAVLARQIRAEAPDRPNETFSTAGFGANVSGQMFTKWREGRDNFTYAVNGGTGIGRYITDLGSLGGQDAVYDPETESLEPLTVFASSWASTGGREFRTPDLGTYVAIDPDT
jgi:hypothetical protein